MTPVITINAIIYTNDASKSCYTPSTLPDTTVSLTKTLGGVTLLPFTENLSPFTPLTMTFIDYVIATTDFRDLVLTAATISNQDSWCTYWGASIRMTYIINPNTKASTSFTATVGVEQTFPITYFTAITLCGSTAPVFVYTGWTDYGLLLPSFISVSTSTGAISVTNAATAGTFNILVIGTLQSNQRATTQFTLLVNTAPSFSFPLANQIVVYK